MFLIIFYFFKEHGKVSPTKGHKEKKTNIKFL